MNGTCWCMGTSCKLAFVSKLAHSHFQENSTPGASVQSVQIVPPEHHSALQRCGMTWQHPCHGTTSCWHVPMLLYGPSPSPWPHPSLAARVPQDHRKNANRQQEQYRTSTVDQFVGRAQWLKLWYVHIFNAAKAQLCDPKLSTSHPVIGTATEEASQGKVHFVLGDAAGHETYTGIYCAPIASLPWGHNETHLLFNSFTRGQTFSPGLILSLPLCLQWFGTLFMCSGCRYKSIQVESVS